ncbi:MAG: hypothetical protein Q9178_007295 [Gyalolechia marmorata]
MGIRTRDRFHTHLSQDLLTCENLVPVVEFIESARGLHELNISDLDAAVNEISLPIWATYRSLQKLYYHSPINRKYRGHGFPRFGYTWSSISLETLGHANPELQELTIDFPYPEGHWPVEHAQIIAKFSRLNKLKIFIELTSEASDFAAEYHQDVMGTVPFPPLNLDAAIKAAINQFKSFFTHNAYSRLTSLELCFLRTCYADRFQSIETESIVRIGRLERHDAPIPLDGGFVVHGSGKWVDCDRSTHPVVWSD